MKARFKAGELATAVGLMAHVVDRSQVQRYPHLGGLVVEADAGIVRLQAGDLDVSAEATVPAEVVEAGHVTLALAELSGLIKGFPEDAPLTISGSTLSAARSRYRLPGLPAGERPERLTVAPDTPALTLTAGDIVGLLTDTSAAAAKEVTRAYLRGIYLHAVGPQLRAVATDGVTLVRSDIAAPAGSANFAALIPGRAAALLLRLAKLNDGELTLRADAHVLSVAGDGRAFTSRLNSGRYPDYRKSFLNRPIAGWRLAGANSKARYSGCLQFPAPGLFPSAGAANGRAFSWDCHSRAPPPTS